MQDLTPSILKNDRVENLKYLAIENRRE